LWDSPFKGRIYFTETMRSTCSIPTTEYLEIRLPASDGNSPIKKRGCVLATVNANAAAGYTVFSMLKGLSKQIRKMA
jgi:hypothetical protein